jgi:hypothetical protein
MPLRVSNSSTSPRDKARPRSGRGLRRTSIREKSAASQLTGRHRGRRSTWTGPVGPLRAEPLSEPLGVDLVRCGLSAELGHDPAENPAVRPAGAGLLGAA